MEVFLQKKMFDSTKIEGAGGASTHTQNAQKPTIFLKIEQKIFLK